jgi:thiamine-monophosphate kinase
MALAELGPEALALAELASVRPRFVHPEPRVAAGRAIAASGLASAAIDVSDGLVQDAGHIAERSGVRTVIEAERVPIAEGCAAVARRIGGDALRCALAGGEDFELLIALDEADLPGLLALEAVAEVGLTVVGHIEAGAGSVGLDEDGREINLPRGGWDHFA